MRKTSVYLSEATKAELHRVSLRAKRSEADLIRQAIEQLIRAADAELASPAPVPVAGLRRPGLVGVGVGPSAPDLATGRAVAVLGAADRVFAASTALDAISRAEAIARAVVPGVTVDRLRFVIADDPDARRAGVADAAAVIVAALDQAQSVAFVTLGDPNVYSVFPELARRVRALRPDVPVDVVPGVMAFQELAARTATVLAEGDEHLQLINQGDDDMATLDAALDRDSCTVVVYKGGRHAPAVADRLAQRDRLDGAVIGELLGVPGGHSGPLADVADRPASYLATVVVPASRPRR